MFRIILPAVIFLSLLFGVSELRPILGLGTDRISDQLVGNVGAPEWPVRGRIAMTGLDSLRGLTECRSGDGAVECASSPSVIATSAALIASAMMFLIGIVAALFRSLPSVIGVIGAAILGATSVPNLIQPELSNISALSGPAFALGGSLLLSLHYFAAQKE